MILKKFIEFINETNMMTAVADGKEPDKREFVKTDMNSFVDQNDEEDNSKPRIDKEGKPIFNTTQYSDGASPSW